MLSVFSAFQRFSGSNGQRVAMQREGVVYYVHTDHLDSTSLTTCGSQDGCDGTPYQGVVARQLYHPYGTVRWSEGTLPTDYTFTGQRNEAGLGLMHYGARFYSPRLGRFVGADTIVPQPGEPQALNRYAYAANNPVIYRDPSGHYITLYGNPGVRYAGPWNQGQRELAVRMDEGQVFVLRGGTEFVNVAEQDLANYYATGNEAYMPAAGGALEGAMGYAINNAAVASGYGARYTSLLSWLAGGYVEPALVIGAGYITQADKEGGAGQGPPAGERLLYTETAPDASAREAAEAQGAMPLPFKNPDLRQRIEDVIKNIGRGGPFPYKRDGIIFRNREGLLPYQEAEDYYREFTVPTPGISGRGAQRLVVSQGGEIYFTPDHYHSFVQIR
jgi:RHS repeat-associated protein